LKPQEDRLKYGERAVRQHLKRSDTNKQQEQVLKEKKKKKKKILETGPVCPLR
jgi:hypothetical protein